MWFVLMSISGLGQDAVCPSPTPPLRYIQCAEAPTVAALILVLTNLNTVILSPIIIDDFLSAVANAAPFVCFGKDCSTSFVRMSYALSRLGIQNSIGSSDSVSPLNHLADCLVSCLQSCISLCSVSIKVVFGNMLVLWPCLSPRGSPHQQRIVKLLLSLLQKIRLVLHSTMMPD